MGTPRALSGHIPRWFKQALWSWCGNYRAGYCKYRRTSLASKESANKNIVFKLFFLWARTFSYLLGQPGEDVQIVRV